MQPTSRSGITRADKFYDFVLLDDTVTPVPLLVAGAGLLIAIAIIHLQDQGGLLGGVSPTWLKYGYYLVEIGALVSALFVIRGKAIGWVLGLASSVGPFVGYILSRSVGVPGDPGDVGNWGYLLGTVSLLVEGSFAIVAVLCLTRLHRTRRPAAIEESQRADSYRERVSQIV
jgi:MFS family permease